jgi:DNA-binding NarL/FixJ family response regulator
MPDRRSDVRVLIVDDARSFRESARNLLQARGYAVVGEADSVQAARRAVADLAPDAVLLDVNLPDGNGFQLAAELTSAEPGLSILLVSACDHSHEPSAAIGFLEKSRLAKVDLTRFFPSP